MGQRPDKVSKIGFTLTAQYISDLRVNVNPFFLQKLLMPLMKQVADTDVSFYV
jgi:hypothetical protein